jgi:hypothetical protein
MKPACHRFVDDQQIGEIPPNGQRPAIKRDLPWTLGILDFQIGRLHQNQASMFLVPPFKKL